MKLYKVYIENTTFVSKDIIVDVNGITSTETVTVEVDSPIIVGYYAVENEQILKQDIFKGYNDFQYEEIPIAYGDISQVINAVNTVNGREMIVEMKNKLDSRTFNNVINFVFGKPLIDKPVVIEQTEQSNQVLDIPDNTLQPTITTVVEEDVTNALKEYFEEQIRQQESQINITADGTSAPLAIEETIVEPIQEMKEQIDKKIQDQIRFIEVRDALLPLLNEELQRILNEQASQLLVHPEPPRTAIGIDIQESDIPIEQPIQAPMQMQQIAEKNIIGIAETKDSDGNIVEKTPLQIKDEISQINMKPIPEKQYVYQQITEDDIQASFVYTTTQLQSEKEVAAMFVAEPNTSVTIQQEYKPISIDILDEKNNGFSGTSVPEIEPLTEKSIVNNFGDSIMSIRR